MRTTLHNLQGLRGIACLLVLGIHMGGWESNFGVAREFLRPFRWFGFAGVDLFFVISGFIIAHTQAGAFGQPRKLPGYLLRRFWRVYPLFWIAMVIAVPLMSWALSECAVDDWGAWLTLTPAEYPNYYIPPAWTLNYEVTFYGAFGLLLLLPRRVAPWLLLAWAIVIGAAQILKTDNSFHAATIGQSLVSPLIWEFLLGCAVAFAVRIFPARFGRLAILAGLLWAAGWMTAFAVPGQPYALCTMVLERSLACGPAAALIVYGCIAAERQGTLRLPKWLQSTGDASYSIYLWHGPVGMSLHYSILGWPHHTAPHLAWLAFMLLVCWGGGMLLHHWVERPLMNLMKREPKRVEPVIIQARVPVLFHGEGHLDELLIGSLGNRGDHVEFECLPDAVAANVLQPLVDDELIFPGFPELGSRPDFHAGLGRVRRNDR